MKKSFEDITDRDEIISLLATDKYRAVYFYTLYGGNVRFAAVNHFDPKALSGIARKVNALKYHRVPLKVFHDSLMRQGLQENHIMRIISHLQRGKYPLQDEGAWSIVLGASGYRGIDGINNDLGAVMGACQLGIIIKIYIYMTLLEESSEKDALQKVQQLGQVQEMIGHLEARVPSLIDNARAKYDILWGKSAIGKLVALPISDILDKTQINDIDIRHLMKETEVRRKTLINKVRQRFKGAVIDKNMRDEQVRFWEEAAPADIIGSAVEEFAAGSKKMSANQKQFHDEWKSHLDAVLRKYTDETTKKAISTTERIITIRYLDKRKDLIPALRFADAASCCFSSVANNDSAAHWITRLYRDPLSSIFLVEYNKPDDAMRTACGFVFSSFGLNEAKKPIILINGVYMQYDKSDKVVQVILNLIENKFSRPMQMAEQFCATRYGGRANLGKEYSRKRRTLLRLRALADENGDPQMDIYDDLLPVGINIPGDTDNEIWGKSLE